MPINYQINDMPWFGKPADPVGAIQAGANLAEQSQRMSQSRDMHPLRMEDLKSATSARDANTNLSKQSYQFNELTQADRVSSVNALSRMQQVSAGIAENTQTAVENLKKSQAWNQSRSDEVRKNIKVELEVQAKEAGHNRAITNQWVNEQTKQGQVDQFNHRTNLLGQQAKAATLQNDVNYANKTLMTEAQTYALENQINGFEVAQRKYELALEGRQPLQDGKLAMEGMSPAQLNALQPPEGLQPHQVTEWKNHRAALLDNFQGREYEAAAQSALASRKKTYTSAQSYSDALSGVGLATVDQNGNLQIDPRNAAKVDMFVKQKELLKDVPQEIQDRILMEVAETNDPLALFGFVDSAGVSLPDSNQSSLAGKNASLYGTKHGGEFVLNDRGMSRLGPLVSKYKAELANAKRVRDMKEITQWGQTITGIELGPEGKMTVTGKNLAMTDDQVAKNVQATFEAKIKDARDAGEDVTEQKRQQYRNEARREVLASSLPRAANGAQAMSIGLEPNAPYWNQSALNTDGTRGGVRQAGVEAPDGTLDVYGRPAAAGQHPMSGASGSTVLPIQGKPSGQAAAGILWPEGGEGAGIPDSVAKATLSKYNYRKGNPRKPTDPINPIALVNKRIKSARSTLETNRVKIEELKSKITGRGRASMDATTRTSKLKAESQRITASLPEMLSDLSKLRSLIPSKPVAPAPPQPEPYTDTRDYSVRRPLHPMPYRRQATPSSAVQEMETTYGNLSRRWAATVDTMSDSELDKLDKEMKDLKEAIRIHKMYEGKGPKLPLPPPPDLLPPSPTVNLQLQRLEIELMKASKDYEKIHKELTASSGEMYTSPSGNSYPVPLGARVNDKGVLVRGTTTKKYKQAQSLVKKISDLQSSIRSLKGKK